MAVDVGNHAEGLGVRGTVIAGRRHAIAAFICGLGISSRFFSVEAPGDCWACNVAPEICCSQASAVVGIVCCLMKE